MIWPANWATTSIDPKFLMQNTKDQKLDEFTSFLLVGDSGTLKTSFFDTCPKPVLVVDTDNGMASLAGKEGIDFQTFRELSYGEKAPSGHLKEQGFYAWGEAWPAITAFVNEYIGRPIDAGVCKYKTLGYDSLTRLTDVAITYILKQNGKRYISDYKDGRQFWGAFLNNMGETFGQLTSWPLVKVLTAHVRRDEDQFSGLTSKMPLVPGQMSAKISTYFDEVYFTDILTEGVGTAKKSRPTIHTQTDSTMRQARSRKFHLPTAVLPPDYRAIMAYVAEHNK